MRIRRPMKHPEKYPAGTETRKAVCKVNLNLEIVGLHEDGYHELSSLFYPLNEPADVMVISEGQPGSGLKIQCGTPGLDGESNTMIKAWRLYAEETGFSPGLCVELTKHIPIGAGLGGGSSDAAVILGYLNARAGDASLSDAGLTALAAKVGADVPFFLYKEPAWATGIGEILSPADIDLSGFFGVLACPPVSVSTSWAYGAWDKEFALKLQDSLTWRRSDIKKMNFSGAWLRNDFEAVVFRKYPEVRIIKEFFLAHGASGSVMSGSGSSVFSLFRERPQAEEASERLRERGVAVYMQEL